MKKFTMTPVHLRLLLSAVLIVLAAAGVGMFAFGYKQLKAHAADAQDVAVKAEASRTSLQDIVAVKSFLANNSDAVDRADQLVAQSKSYSYQDQIISDINTYAREAGIEITNISFDDAKVTAATPVAAGTAATAATPGPAAPAGIKSMTASVTIKNPTGYKPMLTFIHLIEQSLFRMQVSRVGLSQATDKNKPNQITSETFTIEVYVR